ncbi:MAG: DegV family protein [Clostridia bacterium]|jgi:EDD domain protein, DegV family|nr:DegV family protein [Clostridia bacterium]MBQ4452768.1 DegV family protein [Clostridia bacterium]
MADYVLSCCSTADLSREHFDTRNIECIFFSYELDGKTYPDDLGASMPLDTFYQAMENGSSTKTSQISIAEYQDYFEKYLREGKDILHIDFSSGLSGSVNSARNAAEILKEKYPDQKLYVIDSLAASSGYGLLVDKAADLRDEGMDIDELAKWVENNKLRVHHWFFSTTLKYYIRGGRVSKTAGFFGGILGICPLLHVDENGHLIPMEKIRSKKNVKEAIVNKMREFADDGTAYSEKCFMSHSYCLQDAQDVAKAVEQAFPSIRGGVEIDNIGTVIGSHSGPGTVALFFWGKPRG